MSHPNHLTQTLNANNLSGMITHSPERIVGEFSGLVRVSVSQQIRGNYAMAALLQERDDMSPVVARARKAVEEQERRLCRISGGDPNVRVGGAVGEGGLFADVWEDLQSHDGWI